MNMEIPPSNKKVSDLSEEERAELEYSKEALSMNPNLTEQHVRRIEQRENDKKERQYEERSGFGINRKGEIKQIEQQTEEIKKLLEEPVTEPIHEHAPLKTETKNKTAFFKKVVTGLSALFMLGSAAKASGPNEGRMDSAAAKTSKVIEKNAFWAENMDQDVAGIKLMRQVIVPTPDTTKEVSFLSFDGDPNDPNAVEKMRAAVKELGYKLGDDNLLVSMQQLHGAKLAKYINTGISIERTHEDKDDTQGLERDAGASLEVYKTIFPKFLRVDRTERDQMVKLGSSYDYNVIVYKDTNTANYSDFASKK